jgi:hypothetical protein
MLQRILLVSAQQAGAQSNVKSAISSAKDGLIFASSAELPPALRSSAVHSLSCSLPRVLLHVTVTGESCDTSDHWEQTCRHAVWISPPGRSWDAGRGPGSHAHPSAGTELGLQLHWPAANVDISIADICISSARCAFCRGSHSHWQSPSKILRSLAAKAPCASLLSSLSADSPARKAFQYSRTASALRLLFTVTGVERGRRLHRI